MKCLEYLSTINSIVDYIKLKSIDKIINEVSKFYELDTMDLYNKFIKEYFKDSESKDYYFIVEDLKLNIDKYEWLYHRLEDKKSKENLLNFLRYILTLDINFIKDVFDTENKQYFDKNIIKCDENEVFVDYLTYTGDTIKSYINNYKKYKKIYSYQLSSVNNKRCLKNIKEYENIEVRQFVDIRKNKFVNFSQSDSYKSDLYGGVMYNENSEDANIISIDDDIKDKITYLKINIKGEEKKAILGAKRHIKEDSPKLAICLHNIMSDLCNIPLLIESINDKYNFYIRNYNGSVTSEIVLYAVPRKNDKVIEKDKKGFYLIPPMHNYITNLRLTKDVCLIPYFMYKYRGYQSVVISEKDEFIPYLNKYVDGLKIDISNQSLEFNESIMNYIAKNYKEMDNIMLFGLYENNFEKAKFYKSIRPYGKIYLKLDANSGWMDSIDFNSKEVIEFLQNVDVVSVESRMMKQYLSKKIEYKKIHYIPNGYFNDNYDSYINYEEKDNIIITVGRLGTYQKNNEILLEAFKLVADEIPNWKLKLVGNIDEQFYDYIENYFDENPNLRKRVIFMGHINDKEELFNEYKKSKIFVLTSRAEGGSPNVYSEAAFYGNYIITSEIDAAIDMTNNLKNGDIFEIGNILELASILLKRCKNETYIESKCIEIQNYIRCYFDYKRIVSKIDYLLKL